jgi:hypothetical protein
MRTEPATSGTGNRRLTNVKQLVLIGEQTGNIADPGSLEISIATADGHAEIFD